MLKVTIAAIATFLDIVDVAALVAMIVAIRVVAQ